ncbi:hypothetical protein C8R45DRAFT_1005644 [Mycena sanguinolenta]|nr:hypothetical protein C8R45DRAFT_1005644 [Mycena sanguinolenta]
MPTAFDILGVISFVQVAVTLLVAGVLAFQASTQQVRDNRQAVMELVDILTDLHSLYARDTISGEDEQKEFQTVALTAQKFLENLRRMASKSWYVRWVNSAEDAKEIARSKAKLESALSQARQAGRVEGDHLIGDPRGKSEDT